MNDTTLNADAPSTSSVRFRQTRIAMSMFFVVVAVLLCLLWVRSYRKVDRLHVPLGRTLMLISAADKIRIVIVAKDHVPSELNDFQWLSHDVEGFESSISIIPKWSWSFGKHLLSITFPIWFVIVLCILFLCIVWRKWIVWHKPHFSLRTMLIATTLVAVVLGLGVCRAR